MWCGRRNTDMNMRYWYMAMRFEVGQQIGGIGDILATYKSYTCHLLSKLWVIYQLINSKELFCMVVDEEDHKFG